MLMMVSGLIILYLAVNFYESIHGAVVYALFAFSIILILTGSGVAGPWINILESLFR